MNAPLPVIESAVVMPSIGDDVLFQLNGQKVTSPPLVSINGSDQPIHAKVVYVWGPAMVNLVLWDHYGHMHTLTSVKFLPPGEEVPVGQTYCELAVITGELVEGMLDVDALQESALVDTAQQAIDQTDTAMPSRVGPSVKASDIEAQIRSEFFFTAEQGVLGASEMGTKPAAWTSMDQVTICVLILRNGCKVVGVNEGPVSRENFSAVMGRQFARQKAIDQIWPMLGYELRTKLANTGGPT